MGPRNSRVTLQDMREHTANGGHAIALINMNALRSRDVTAYAGMS